MKLWFLFACSITSVVKEGSSLNVSVSTFEKDFVLLCLKLMVDVFTFLFVISIYSISIGTPFVFSCDPLFENICLLSFNVSAEGYEPIVGPVIAGKPAP